MVDKLVCKIKESFCVYELVLVKHLINLMLQLVPANGDSRFVIVVDNLLTKNFHFRFDFLKSLWARLVAID